jgi:hypothetical protein
VPAAEQYILKSFKEDKRFVYFFGNTWQRFYEQKNHPQAYQKLMQRVRKLYDEKMASDAEHRALLQRYGESLSRQLEAGQ